MGIRFYCPNGHKMNVKTFQAGQRGICPTCGAKMQIPWKSTRRSSRPKKSESSTSEISPPINIPLPETTAGSGDSAASVFTASPESSPLAATVFPPAPVTDLLDPASTAVWYVQPPSGGQLGPVRAEMMQNWIAEGRLTADCLIWREGWSEWKVAVNVFSQLSPKLVIPELERLFGSSETERAEDRTSVTHGPSRKVQLFTLGSLGIAIFLLIGIFFVLWFTQ